MIELTKEGTEQETRKRLEGRAAEYLMFMDEECL